MEPITATKIIELIALGLEFLGVAVITLAFLYATIRALLHYRQRKPDAYQRLKIYIGKALQLGLEFLVAADIIRTVTIEPTREGILLLGLLIVVRTFLSWSIAVEIDGCWPWQVAKSREV
jgi:uncharacterized membrane protein